jgi:cytochrome c-type biogenesis protein CcmH/NrfG
MPTAGRTVRWSGERESAILVENGTDLTPGRDPRNLLSSMSSGPRFCPECGTKALSGAKFCIDCGTPLVAGAKARATAAGWRPTAAGSTMLSVFLVGGLAIWTAILSPDPPRPGPGAAAPRAAAPPSQAAAGLPEGHPTTPIALPADVKSFIADLDAKAQKNPRDLESWLRLAQVNARAAQLDPSYSDPALAAFRHVVEIEPKNVEGLRGLANMYYDRNDHKAAIPLFEKLLALRPDDASARTDLGTMYLYAGDAARSIATYQEVIKRNPDFLQAHYNLAVTYHRQGKEKEALAELQTARGLATEDAVRKQIDEMIVSLGGKPPATAPAVEAAAGTRSPFQAAVEDAFRAHPIMGPRIARFEWPAAGSGRVVVENFPMAAMPPAVREKFLSRLTDNIRAARESHPVDGAIQVEIADASGSVMATVVP